MSNINIHNADVLEYLKNYTGEKFHSVLADVPYGISFMGKSWDKYTPIQYQTWCSEWGSELIKHLYPGAVCMFFGGTRTYHRLATGLEDAGFEIFDSMIWCYGSGFPKSYNISKGIDSRGGKSYSWFADYLRKIRIEKGLTQSDLSKYFPSKTGGLTGCVCNWELGYNTPTPDQFNKLVEILDLPFENMESLERDIIETKIDSGNRQITILGDKEREYNITKPNHQLAHQYNGYGTALKPAYEPIVLCRKPRGKETFVDCALNYGTGSLNVDGSRIEYNGPVIETNRIASKSDNTKMGLFKENSKLSTPSDLGRFPANLGLICDCEKEPCECIERELDNQSGMSKSAASDYNWQESNNNNSVPIAKNIKSGIHFGDTGGASRFFYTAKSSRKERNLGLDHLPTVLAGGMSARQDGSLDGHVVYAKNNHPTVKPIKLIEYLATMLKPPIDDSSILIPFSGSGSEVIGAMFAGWNNITGIEIDSDYVGIADERIKYWSKFDSYERAMRNEN